jgi:MFS family permease
MMPRVDGPSRDRRWLYAAGFCRSVGVGMSGILLGVGLAKGGRGPDEVGVVVAAGLAGGAVATIASSLFAERVGPRAVLLVVSGLAFLGGTGVALADDFLLLAVTAFLGMANGMGRDRAAAYSLEQAILPSTVPAARRTGAFAVHSLALDLGHALGGALAALPWLLREVGGVGEEESYRAALAVAAGTNLLSLRCYLRLSSAVSERAPAARRGLSPASRRFVARFAAISALDSFGGGFLAGALVSAWFLARFGAGEEVLGPLFVLARGANLVSYFVAVRLARRFGLLNTMVFTHLPAHLLLVAMALAPSLGVAIALSLAREFLVEMDLPTRTAFLTSAVRPEERAIATGVTNMARVGAWAVAPAIAGKTMAGLSLAAPFFAGAAIKVAYDLLLWRAFRRTALDIESAG